MQYQLQTSADNATWAALATSSAVTTTGVTRVSSQQPVDRYVRLVSTAIGGTTPSFTVTATASADTALPVSNVQQYVRLGRQAQAAANVGALFSAGMSLTYSAQSEVWAIPQATNGAVVISVVEERSL